MAVTSVQFAVATHIMTVLGFHPGAEMTSSALSGSVNAEPTFVRKSLSKLVKAGLVITTRGKNGSCTLARAPDKITLRDIYIASEAPSAFAVHTYPADQRCPISCHFKACLSTIQAETQCRLEQALAQTTLADVVANIRTRTDLAVE